MSTVHFTKLDLSLISLFFTCLILFFVNICLIYVRVIIISFYSQTRKLILTVNLTTFWQLYKVTLEVKPNFLFTLWGQIGLIPLSILRADNSYHLILFQSFCLLYYLPRSFTEPMYITFPYYLTQDIELTTCEKPDMFQPMYQMTYEAKKMEIIN